VAGVTLCDVGIQTRQCEIACSGGSTWRSADGTEVNEPLLAGCHSPRRATCLGASTAFLAFLQDIHDGLYRGSMRQAKPL